MKDVLLEAAIMNVSLTDELERFIGDLVDAGRYRSASEVVRAAVRLLQEREEERKLKLDALRSSVGAGVGELERGEGVEGERVFEEILEALRSSEAA